MKEPGSGCGVGRRGCSRVGWSLASRGPHPSRGGREVHRQPRRGDGGGDAGPLASPRGPRFPRVWGKNGCLGVCPLGRAGVVLQWEILGADLPVRLRRASWGRPFGATRGTFRGWQWPRPPNLELLPRAPLREGGCWGVPLGTYSTCQGGRQQGGRDGRALGWQGRDGRAGRWHSTAWQGAGGAGQAACTQQLSALLPAPARPQPLPHGTDGFNTFLGLFFL